MFESTKEPEPNVQKKKILCLHGFATTKEFMNFQTREWQQVFSNELELIFIDGKFEVPKEKINPFLAKWFTDRNLNPKSHFSTTEVDLEYWQSLPKDQDMPIKLRDAMFSKIVDTLNEHKDIEGIMGFSQGAFLASTFFQFLEKGVFKNVLLTEKIPHFLISVCGWAGIGRTIIKAKSLHFIGANDEIYDMAELALIRFRKPKVFYFQEGHKFPIINKKIKETVKGFIKKTDEVVYRELIEYDFIRPKL